MLGIITFTVPKVEKVPTEMVLEGLKRKYFHNSDGGNFNLGTNEDEKYFTFKVRYEDENLLSLIKCCGNIFNDLFYSLDLMVVEILYINQEVFFDDDYMMEFLLQGEEKNE